MARRPGSIPAALAATAVLFVTGGFGAGAALGVSRGTDPVTCSGPTPDGVVNVHTSADVLAVERSGNDLTFTGDFSFTVPCGTVFNVNTVNIDLGNGTNPTVGFLLDGGAFAPGKNEIGSVSAEIEFHIDNPGLNGRIEVLGTDDPNGFTFGQRRNPTTFVDEPLINMNALQDGATPDVDITSDSVIRQIGIRTYGGNDVVSGAGTGTIQAVAYGGSSDIGDGPGADQVTGGAGSDAIFTDDDPDPGDTFRGGAGSDQLYYDHRLDEISISQNKLADDGHACPGGGCEGDNVGRDIEYFRLGGGSDRFVGGAKGQTVDSGFGNDVLIGGPGPDIFFGGPGADIFQGGKGLDIVQFGGSDPITVRLNGQPDDGPANEMDDVKPDVEGVVAGSGNDHLVGNDARNLFIGGAGNDLLEGHGGNDTFEQQGVAFGSQQGDDVYLGGPGTDTVALDFLLGDVRVSLDDVKNDQVLGDPAKGVKNVHSDVENVITGPGDDEITGSAKPNRLVGGEGKDTLLGGGGNDLLLPGPGGDAVRGGPGLDTASFAGAAHAVNANLANGSASGDGPDVLATLERLVGTAFADHLTGNAGANVLTGGAGGDDLAALDGNDRLVGEAGNDSFAGGPGVDTCLQGAGTGPKTGCEH